MVESTSFKVEGELESVNRRSDAPTIFADSVQGMMLSPQVVKVSFVEQILIGDAVKAKHVLNLAMPKDQLEAIGTLFLKIAKDTSVQDQLAQAGNVGN